MDYDHRILPYYLTYPGRMAARGEDAMLRDMEYFQQTYPCQVRRYQRRISQILDKLDYDGSMIYDEYPDRYSLERLGKDILRTLKKEEESDPSNPMPPRDLAWLEELVQVLLCNEVCKRRHGGRRGMIYF